MPKIGIQRSDIFVGAMNIPGRKKPCLVIERGNVVKVIGTFSNKESVDRFVEVLDEVITNG